MLIGIKYCGGCNCHYDRVKFVDNFKKRLMDLEFCSVEKTKKVDYLLVVCGCSSVCAQTEGVYSKYGMFLLSNPSQQTELIEKIKMIASQQEIEKKMKKKLILGQTFERNKKLTEASVVLFTDLTEDFNPIYTDNNFAQSLNFVKRVYPPRLLTDYFSATMGTIFPGEGAVMMEERATYHHPVFAGDSLYMAVKFLHCEEKTTYYTGIFTVECKNDKAELVALYEAKQRLSKDLFEVDSL